jgi:hypothetical protein
MENGNGLSINLSKGYVVDCINALKEHFAMLFWKKEFHWIKII